jgi:transcription antitermination factor NusG
MRGSPPDGAWVAVQVQSNMERRVFIALKERNYESFLPTYKALRKWCDRTVELELPLFRGYLFCRWLHQFRQPIVQVPGVIRVLGFGKTPACVDEAEIMAVRRIVHSGVLSMPWKFLYAGDRVRLTSGALRGLEGVFAQAVSGTYVIVNVMLLGRAVAVRIHPSQLAPCEGTSPRLKAD